MIDLHIHSTFSDGTMTPSEIIFEAEKCSLKAIALTDHDTVAGNNEFLEKGKNSTVTTIAGVEISAEYSHPENSSSKGGEMHILGFFSCRSCPSQSGPCGLIRAVDAEWQRTQSDSV